jgi:hypothetical protein
MHFRRRIIRISPAMTAPGNAVQEQLGELPEDLMSERIMRPPVLSPRLVQLAPGQPATFIPGAMGPPPLPRYKSSITPFVAQVASAKALPANSLRAFLLVQNNDGTGNSIFVNFGSDANSTNSLVVIDGGNVVFTGGGPTGGAFVPLEDVYISSQGANSACVVMEGLMSV